MNSHSAEGALTPKNTSDEPLIVTLDVGTSSVRTLLFDAQAREMEGFGTQRGYHVATTPDGGVEVEADHLAALSIEALSFIHAQMKTAKLHPAAVACCTFWHNVLGIGADERPTTPVLHLFDTRSAAAARKLAQQFDVRYLHERTGCVLHPSYLPAKLLWLSENRPEAFRATRRWMSFGEYLFLKLFGRAVASTSMVSGSGLWNQNENDYDAVVLSALPIDKGQLTPEREMDEPLKDLRGEYKSQWHGLAGAPWYPALGDGACNNIGSGCHAPDRFALMVGTSGAMRAVIEQPRIEIPDSLWCYRVDRRRFVLGGALSNGGLVFEWMSRTLALPADRQETEKQVAALAPDSHGLTFLPFFAGERSTKWRADARAAVTGMSMNTRPVDLLRAALESVALRFREVYELMTAQLDHTGASSSSSVSASGLSDRGSRQPQASSGVPRDVVASGGALIHSPAWTQMIADALDRPVTLCLEKEASSRGAALLALERLRVISHVRDLPARMGSTLEPVEGHHQAYERALRRQRRLYGKLFEEDETV